MGRYKTYASKSKKRSKRARSFKAAREKNKLCVNETMSEQLNESVDDVQQLNESVDDVHGTIPPGPQPGPSGLQLQLEGTPRDRPTTRRCYVVKPKSILSSLPTSTNCGNRDVKNGQDQDYEGNPTPELGERTPPRYCDNSSVDDGVGQLDTDQGQDLPELIVETTSRPTTYEAATTGRRIVDIFHVAKEILKLGEHARLCTTGRYTLVGEVKINGLQSALKFHCSNCNRDSYVDTDGGKSGEINDHLVWGATSIGSGYSQMQELLAILDIPFMADKTYKKSECKVFETWESHLSEKMASAGRMEKEIAIAKGHVDENGFPVIRVIGDGGWCTRTYGHSFGASSGVACIIGAETKQLLFVGVRNKYCYVCSRHTSKPLAETPPAHKCFKNYAGPSTGMETEIIVEGFNRSEEQHGLRYKYYIGDGDSSVYPRIKKSVSYGRSVVKLECANHVVRCYTSKLHTLKKNMKFDSSARKVLSDKLPRLTTAARSAIRQSAEHQDVRLLQEDLLNGPRHVFGDHLQCRPCEGDQPSTSTRGYCKKKDAKTENYVPMMKECGMLEYVMTHLDYVVSKANSLRFNVTNNQAERFNSMVAKLVSGKRVDHSKRGGYRGRIFGAGLAHSSGPSWHLSPLKRLTGRSPGKFTKKEFSRRKSKSDSASRRRLDAGPSFKKKTVTGPDREYGPLAAQEDMPDNVLQQKCHDFLETQKAHVDSIEKQNDIQERTKGQSDCALWRELRQDRLTASNFGSVIQRRPTTSCHKMVERLLYNTYDLSKNKNVVFGRQHERTGILKYQSETGQHVLPCGIFIDMENPFLGASPDGLIGNEGIIEVKTIPSIGNKTIEEAFSTKTNFCLEKTKDKNTIQLKRKHHYYYQIQGQLAIAKKSFCDFIVYASNAYFVERIYPDEDLWKNVMLPKLKDFYLHCILPELVDPRVPRGLEVRDPQTILQARVEQQQKKEIAVQKKRKRAESNT